MLDGLDVGRRLSCESLSKRSGGGRKDPGKKKTASLVYNKKWTRDRNLSQALSNYLRHSADPSLFDSGGWMTVSDFVDGVAAGMGSEPPYTKDEIHALIFSQEKQDLRHEWNVVGGTPYVRCFQGHNADYFIEKGGNINRDHLYTRFDTPPPYPVFHSTTIEAAAGIRGAGLLPGGDDGRDTNMWYPGGEKKGRGFERTPLTVKINLRTAMREGIPFWRAGNGVILTNEPIPPEHLTFFEVVNGEVPWDDEFFTAVG
jgi:RNA:NAD 2'-phosphotransferase (TPT1/KptA family)